MEFSFFSMISQASLVAKDRAVHPGAHVRGQLGHDDPENPGPQRRLPQGPAGQPTCSRRPPACVRPCSPGLRPCVPALFRGPSGRDGVQPLQGSRQQQRDRGGQRAPLPAPGRGKRDGPSGTLPLPATTTANTAPLHRPVRYGVGHHALLPLHRHAQVRLPVTVAPRHLRSPGTTAIGLGVAVPATIGFNIFMGKLAGGHPAGELCRRVPQPLQRELNAHRPCSAGRHGDVRWAPAWAATTALSPRST